MPFTHWSYKDGYLMADSEVGRFRVAVAALAIMDQAVNLITYRIKGKRYAAAH